MAEIRRCATYQGRPTSKRERAKPHHIQTASLHKKNSVQDDQQGSEVYSPMKRISQIMDESKDREVSHFLQFTMAEDGREDARTKMRKRDRLKTESDFHLYTRAVSYSRERGLKRAFDTRFKPTYTPGARQFGLVTLADIVGKRESQSLIEQNRNTRDNYITENFLNDPELREKTLQKALLFERFYDIKRSELPRSTSNTTAGTVQVPKRFKSINPKHMRIKTEGCFNEQNFRRRKYIETKTRLQYFSKAMKVAQNDVDNRRKDNAQLINMLVEINLNQRVEKPQYRQQSRLLKRLYLHYSNHHGDDPASLYTYVPLDRVVSFVGDFCPEIKLEDITRLYQKMQPVNIFKLYELMHSFCRLIYGSSQKQLVSQFLTQRIQPKRHYFLDSIWQELEQNEKDIKLLHRTDRRIAQSVWQLFEKGIKDALSKQQINFSEVFQTLWEFNIFPNHLAKSKIRYFYEYCCLEGDGLLFEEFSELMDGVCLYIERDSSQLRARQKIAKVYAHYNYFEKAAPS